MSSSLAFRLKLPGTDTLSGLNAVSTSFRVHGLLWLEGDLLIIQWGGAVRVQDVSPLGLSDTREPLPDERVAVPVHDLHRARVAGGWWRPRLILRAGTPGALGEVPGETAGVVTLWIARADRAAGRALSSAINDAISGLLEPTTG